MVEAGSGEAMKSSVSTLLRGAFVAAVILFLSRAYVSSKRVAMERITGNPVSWWDAFVVSQ